MKLLIITQKVDLNDDVLGFFHGWLLEFSKHCEKIIAICLQEGKHNLPDNIKVLNLGKDKNTTNLKLFNKIKYLVKFYSFIWKFRREYDAVFVHMNPEYVGLGGVFWKIFNKKITLWYTHKAVNLKLRIAERLTDIIFTASRDSFRLPSDKVVITGHGIDMDKFKQQHEGDAKRSFKIITVGRISPVKDYETLINAAEILKQSMVFEIEIIGKPGLPEHEVYLDKLKRLVKEKKLTDCVDFKGAISNKNIQKFLTDADVFVNMSHTGSLDKAILEAMASKLPVITCNEAATDILGNLKKDLFFEKDNVNMLAEKIEYIYNLNKAQKDRIKETFKNIVEIDHNLKNLIQKILININA